MGLLQSLRPKLYSNVVAANRGAGPADFAASRAVDKGRIHSDFEGEVSYLALNTGVRDTEVEKREPLSRQAPLQVFARFLPNLFSHV